MSLDEAIKALEESQGNSLTKSLAQIEADIVGMRANAVENMCNSRQIDSSFLELAGSVKKLAGQINVVIHAAGILCALPRILEEGEVIESVSLGAGNTGRKFDLETNFRIAEFKFIDWQGGPETIRQNSIFKDFFELAEFETDKSKQLYVVGTEFPLKFLRGGRALTSVLSRMPVILRRINEIYGKEVRRVRDYFVLKETEVEIRDISSLIAGNN
jgi:hypothetical protein